MRKLLGTILCGLIVPICLAAPSSADSWLKPWRTNYHVRGNDGMPAHQGGGGGLAFSPRPPMPKAADDVVGVILKKNSGGDLGNQAVTFGEVFVAGKVRRDAGLVAKIDGKDLPAQLDVKAMNPDGSVRMGIVSLIVPASSGSSSVPVMLSQGPRSAGADVDLAALRDYRLTVDIAVQGGQSYRLDASRLLTQALNEKAVSYWLRGPQVTEARIDKPVTGSLHVTFDIRAYANGAILTDVTLRNDYALQAAGGPVTYDVTISSNGAKAFSQQSVMQLQYTHWHKLVGPGKPSDIQIIHDIAALERSNAILDYDLQSGVQVNLIRRNRELMDGDGFGILGNAGLAWNMAITGGRNDIGPTTQANTIWLLTQDTDAQAFALSEADAAGSVPWHYYDAPHGTYLTAARYPNLWADPRAAREGLRGLTQQIHEFSKGCGCFNMDAAHQPDLSFIAYILTGERYYLDQLEAQASWDIIGWDPRLRQTDKGIVFFPQTQARAQAWSFRGIINAAWIIPDGDPLKPVFVQAQANNLEFLLKEIHSLREGEAYGWIPGNSYSDESGAIPPWQQDFIAYIMTLAAKRGDARALEVLKWQSNYLAGRFLAGPRGYPAYDGAAYRMNTFAAPDQFKGAYQTWAQIAKATADHGFSGGGNDWPKKTFPEYVLAAKGVLAGIVRLTGSEDARKAYLWIDDHAPKADKAKDQKDPAWRVALPD